MAKIKIWLQWNNDSLFWGDNPYIWSEVYILKEVGESFGGGGIVLPLKDTWKELDKHLDKKEFSEEKKRIFLQVIARVNGLVTSEVKDIDSVKKKITVDHIKKTFESFGQKVEVKVKNVKR